MRVYIILQLPSHDSGDKNNDLYIFLGTIHLPGEPKSVQVRTDHDFGTLHVEKH
jgi:hypothetical protein